MQERNNKNGNILTVRGLCAGYKTRRTADRGKKTEVLKDISFELKRGEILGLVGESGSGKSTLAKALLGMVKPDSGEIIHASAQPQMVFQDPYGSLNPVKRIGWILEEPLRLRGGCLKEERISKVKNMLEKVGLEEGLLDRYPSQLSGGQRQRVAIAGALMQEPELLIADEPVSALDVTVQAQITELLLKLHKEMGLAVLFISHDLRVVYQMCDRVIIMKAGEIVEAGVTEEVYDNPRHGYTKILLEAAGIREG